MQQILINLVAVAFALGVIISIHEIGHLAVAKLLGMRVVTFSLGFGKRIWGFVFHETEYRLALVPLGGYVKLGGENLEEASGDARDFVNRPRWQRILVYLAGPAMNVVLAVALIALVFVLGVDIPNPAKLPPVVWEVAEGSPAAAAGIQANDRVVSVDGKPVSDWQQIFMAVTMSPERPLHLTLQRDGKVIETILTPERVPRYEVGNAGFWPIGKLVVNAVNAGGPAAAAGFAAGDELRAIDGRPVGSSQDFVSYVETHAGQKIAVEVRRGGRSVALHVEPRAEDGKGRIGVELTYSYFQRYPPGEAIVESLRYNADIVTSTFAVLGKIFTRQVSAKSALSGPIEIASMSGREARRGFKYLLHLMGVISVSVAILNLLPIPILDGGQIFILLIESGMRRDLSLAVKERVNQAGFIVLMVLMLAVIFFDLQKTVPGLLSGS